MALHAIDLTKSPKAGLLFTSIASRQCCGLATIVETIRSTLVQSDRSNDQTGGDLNDKGGTQQDDDASTISEEEYIVDTLWTFKAVETVRLQDDDLHWCIVLEDNSIVTEWYENVSVLGHKLSEYATYSLPVGSGTFVTWHRQWVTADRVPYEGRCGYLASLLAIGIDGEEHL